MFSLSIRIWCDKQMFYPTLFSVNYIVDKRKSNVRTFINNIRIDTMDYMTKTPWLARNGDIFEMDIIHCTIKKELAENYASRDLELTGMVWFDSKKGRFLIRTADGDREFSEDYRCEIIGNYFEDKPLIKDIKIPEGCPVNESLETKVDKKENSERKQETQTPVKEEKTKEEPISEIKKETAVKTEAVKKDMGGQKKKGIKIPLAFTAPAPTSKKEEIKERAPEEVKPAKPEIKLKEVPKEDIQKSILISETDKQQMEVFLSTVIEDGKRQINISYKRDGRAEEVSVSKDIEDIKKFYLMAALMVFKKLEGKFSLTIHCDIPFITTPFENEWLKKWKENGWKKDSGDDVQYSNLWQELYGLTLKHDAKWVKTTK